MTGRRRRKARAGGWLASSEKTLSFLETTKDRILFAALTRKNRVADRICGLAQSLHGPGEQFAGRQYRAAAAIGRSAAGRRGALSRGVRTGLRWAHPAYPCQERAAQLS